MDYSAARGHPVLYYLAIVRAARDFGLGPDELEPLALRFRPGPGSVDDLADAVASALLKRNW